MNGPDGTPIPEPGEALMPKAAFACNLRLLCCAAMFFLGARVVHACGVCTAAHVWAWYPPFLAWSAVVAGWFFAFSLLGSVYHRSLVPVPRTLVGLPILAVATLVALASFGPLVAVPLGVVCVWAWIRLAVDRKGALPADLRRWGRGIGAFAVGIIAISLIAESISPTPREPIDIIRKWPGTSASRIALNRLGAEAAASRETLRSIVRGTPGEFDPMQAWQAAGMLRVLEAPEVDVPPLLDAYARLYDPQSETGWPSSPIEWALKEHTGLELPHHSAPDVWQTAWAEWLSTRGDEAARRPDVDGARENLL
jgi:hypothetical protein